MTFAIRVRVEGSQSYIFLWVFLKKIPIGELTFFVYIFLDYEKNIRNGIRLPARILRLLIAYIPHNKNSNLALCLLAVFPIYHPLA
jgi:hypothetical protein